MYYLPSPTDLVLCPKCVPTELSNKYGLVFVTKQTLLGKQTLFCCCSTLTIPPPPPQPRHFSLCVGVETYLASTGLVTCSYLIALLHGVFLLVTCGSV